MTILSERRVTRLAATRSRGLRFVAPAAALLDLAIIAVACLLGLLTRNTLPFFNGVVTAHAAVAAPFVIIGWPIVLALFGAYREDAFGAGTDEFKQMFNASLYAAGVLCVACYLAHFQLSRGFFVLTFVFGIPALLVGRMVLRSVMHSLRLRGALLQRVLIVGGAVHVDEIAGVLLRERWLGYHVVGALTPDGLAGEETPGGVPVVGGADTISVHAESAEIDVLFLAGGTDVSGAELRRLVWELEEHAIQLVMAPSMTEISGERVRVQPVAGLPLVHVAPPTWSGATRAGKRIFDIVGCCFILFLVAPLLLLISVLIKLHDGGPVFFRQTRVGRDGESFGCFKFRTMVVDAEARVAELQRELGTSALLFKMKDDPRITGPGQWLRRLSLDELPQLFNVFRGEMSLVGPRPQVPAEVALYDDDFRRRLHVRPGMTGLWQVSGRNDLSVEDAVRLDLFYVDNWSMVQDLSILARTFGAVLARDGAY